MTKHLHIFDEKGEPEVIAWFDDFDGPHRYRALSNFHIGEPLYIPVVDDTFMTGEHAYAAIKAFFGSDYAKIRDADSPGKAKALGQVCVLRDDWEAVKYDVMMAVLRAKFEMQREEAGVLLATGDALLIEGTYWEDSVWGVDLQADENPFTSPGRNWLGTMLMARRAELKAEALYGHRHNTGHYNAQFAK